MAGYKPQIPFPQCKMEQKEKGRKEADRFWDYAVNGYNAYDDNMNIIRIPNKTDPITDMLKNLSKYDFWEDRESPEYIEGIAERTKELILDYVKTRQ